MPYKDWNQIRRQQNEERAEQEEGVKQRAAAAAIVVAQRSASHAQVSSRSVDVASVLAADGLARQRDEDDREYGKYEMANLLRAKGATDEYTKYIAPTTYEAGEEGSPDNTQESPISQQKQ